VHRIYWLDNPRFDRTQRAALIKAFDEAATYDESARTASTRATTAAYAIAKTARRFRVTGHGSRVTSQ
jgi:hypothetical protein